jgi:hypothetical protein
MKYLFYVLATPVILLMLLLDAEFREQMQRIGWMNRERNRV